MNVIAYRLPDAGAAVISKVRPVESENTSGERFLIAPFDPEELPHYYLLTSPLTEIPSSVLADNHRTYSFKELTFGEYSDYIKDIKNFIDGDADKKIVASRRKKVRLTISPQSLFDTLCATFPSAFVFFVSTKEFGTWIGASPELLLERRGQTLFTMALAGTRTAGSCGNWDSKNSKEQQIVADYIAKAFVDHGCICSVGLRRTLKAGPVEHLMTPITGGLTDRCDPGALLRTLSPTPALSGFPKEEALRIIKNHEGSRQLYGGYCGPLRADGDFRLNVVLRCAYLSATPEPTATLFAGGGITSLSEVSDEWTETENKFSTLLKFINPDIIQ